MEDTRARYDARTRRACVWGFESSLHIRQLCARFFLFVSVCVLNERCKRKGSADA